MLEIADILAKAKGSGKLINTIVLLAIGVIWAISQVFMKREREKTAQKAEQERLQRDAEKAGGPFARPDDLPRKAPHPPMPTTRAQQPERQSTRREPVPIFPPPMAPVLVSPQPARRPAPVPVFPEPLGPQAAPAPSQLVAAKSAARPSLRTVHEEITRLQSKLRKLEHLSVSNLEMEPSPEADTAAIEARLISIRPAKADRAVAGNSFIAVNLLNPTNARNAIIMHEIFSPPKALRNQDELWDAY